MIYLLLCNSMEFGRAQGDVEHTPLDSVSCIDFVDIILTDYLWAVKHQYCNPSYDIYNLLNY